MYKNNGVLNISTRAPECASSMLFPYKAFDVCSLQPVFFIVRVNLDLTLTHTIRASFSFFFILRTGNVQIVLIVQFCRTTLNFAQFKP